MALTQSDLTTLRGLNTDMRLTLAPDRNGVANNRLIIWGKPSGGTITFHQGAVVLTGVSFQQGFIVSKNGVPAYKNITPNIVT